MIELFEHFAMPNLLVSLTKYDLGHLRIISSMWGIELGSNDFDEAAKELSESILDLTLLTETLELLPEKAATALDALVTGNGRITWASFTRQFGDIREMGAGKRDREKPHRSPASPAETLFYHGLLARAFFDTSKGPQEFAYIPDDLYHLMLREGHPARVDSTTLGEDLKGTSGENSAHSLDPADESIPLGRPASPGERAQPLPPNDMLLDDATTLLAALRMGIDPPQMHIPLPVLEDFLRSAKIIQKSGPQPEAVKRFLEASRDEALRLLTDSWLESDSFNELRQLPGLAFEGEWKNQPVVTREFLLDLLDAIPTDQWWSLPAFIRKVKDRYPDFQRPAGDYDSWYIKRTDGEYLRGFASWDQVDGALIKYFITGILYWLEQVELAAPEAGLETTAFRVLDSRDRKELQEDKKLHSTSDGKITVPRFVPRVVRYQVSRFCEWEESKKDEYRIQLTPASMKMATQQGLKVEHLLTLLNKHASGGIPPVLVRALKRWEENGVEAWVQTRVVLKVSTPEILGELRKSKAARYLGEALGPTSVVIKEGAQSKVLAALAEMGLLAEEIQVG
jgi:hypothetical protein